MMTTLFEIAQNWLNQDPDAETHAELTALLSAAKSGDAKAEAELAARFDGRLQFGTAGLRGRLQAGSMGMNRVLVAQAAAWCGCLLAFAVRAKCATCALRHCYLWQTMRLRPHYGA